MIGLGLGIGLGGGGGGVNAGIVLANKLLAIPNCVQLCLADFKTLNGSNVAALADQTGLGNGFTQVTGANQPPWSASGIGGQPSIDTTGSGAAPSMCLNAQTNSSAIFTGVAAERFLVVQASAVQNTGQGVFWTGTGTDAQASYLPYQADSNIYDDFCTSARQQPGLIDVHTAPVVYSVTSSATDWTAYINGGSVFTTGTNTFGAPAAAATMLGSAANSVWLGKWSSLVSYNRELTAPERATVVAALRSRYGF